MKKFSIILLSLCLIVSASAFAYEEQEDISSSSSGYGQMGTPYNPYYNDYYYRESVDGYWRGPRVAVYASDGSVRYVSRRFLNNTGYGMPGYNWGPRPVGGPYSNNFEYHRRYKRSGGILTTLLDVLI